MENYPSNSAKRPNPNRTITVENASRSSAVALGAMIASLAAAAWVLQYLLVTVYGSYGMGTSLMNYVSGAEYGTAFDDAGTLTVCFLRFVLAFGFTWPLATLIVAIQQFITRKMSK